MTPEERVFVTGAFAEIEEGLRSLFAEEKDLQVKLYEAREKIKEYRKKIKELLELAGGYNDGEGSP